MDTPIQFSAHDRDQIKSMNLRQLRYFVVLAEELHFHRAARRLNITQSPLTLAIQELERELGGNLLLRTRRAVELTEAGRAFQRDARAILDQVRLSLEATRNLISKDTAPLRMGFAPGTTLLPFFSVAIQEFSRLNPSVRLSIAQIDSGQEVEALHRRELDACIVRSVRQRESTRVERVTLVKERLMAVMHREHALGEQESLSVSDLKEEGLILPANRCGSEVRELIDSLFVRHSFRPRVGHEVCDLAMMMSLAVARLGVAILPGALDRIRAPDLSMIPLNDLGASTDVCVAYRSAEDDLRVSSLCEIVITAACGGVVTEPDHHARTA
jgi:DNA-binding transcriptional LysR family regulator